MASQSMTLFQNETGVGPAKALLAAGIEAALGEGIRASYGIVGIKAGKFRIKYKGQEHLVQQINPANGQAEPVSSIEVVIIKANPFLNKQYYAGKYTEGSNAAPDCYSLDGQVPSPSIAKPVFNNCTLCPKNAWGSMVSETGIKQKACRDTKKLAIVPLGDMRNESMGGPMLFRVPPSSLKDLSQLADAMKARGYPYNSVAVRIGFDMEASHPKPTFKAIRPLTDAEAEIVLELFHGDGVAAVLSDNDAAVDAIVAPVEKHSDFEQEPLVPVGVPVGQVPAGTIAKVQGPAPLVMVPIVETPVEAPTRFVAPAVAPAPAGMSHSSVAAFHPGVPAPGGAFSPAAPVAAPPVNQAAPVAFAPPKAVGRPKKVAAPAVVQEAAPVLIEPTPDAEPSGSTLSDDIQTILAGLNAFTSGK